MLQRDSDVLETLLRKEEELLLRIESLTEEISSLQSNSAIATTAVAGPSELV